MRRLSYILLFAFLCMVFNGCQNTKQVNKPSQPENKAENRLIEAVLSKSIDIKGLTGLDEFSYDLDLDNTEEKIELYTAAGRDTKGRMMWDDGENWLLVVMDGEKAYPLLSQYVQLGSVYYNVSNSGMDKLSHINVFICEGAGFSLKTYIFDKDKNGFIEEVVYKSKDDSFVHTSIPGY